jgi:hypothetical protein
MIISGSLTMLPKNAPWRAWLESSNAGNDAVGPKSDDTVQ